jgi:mono/diheme cytochrome c family protein
MSLAADKTAGAMVFSQTCAAATCHGADGSAGPAPNLPDEIPEFDSEALTCLLLNGTDEMPPQAALSDQQLADVIAYVQAKF